MASGLGERRGGGGRSGRGRLISEWTVDQGGVCKYTSCIIYRRQKGFMCRRRNGMTVVGVISCGCGCCERVGDCCGG